MATWTWRTPVTDRTSGTDRMRYTDMIRITENINYVMEIARDKGYSIYGEEIYKTNWVRNDIITKEDWTEILGTLRAVAEGIHYAYYDDEEPSFAMTFRNINIVEELTFKFKNIIERTTDMSRMNHWVGDPVFATSGYNQYGREPIVAGGSY